MLKSITLRTLAILHWVYLLDCLHWIVLTVYLYIRNLYLYQNITPGRKITAEWRYSSVFSIVIFHHIANKLMWGNVSSEIPSLSLAGGLGEIRSTEDSVSASTHSEACILKQCSTSPPLFHKALFKCTQVFFLSVFMVLETEWQDFYIINWRNSLENLLIISVILENSQWKSSVSEYSSGTCTCSSFNVDR